MKSVLQQAAIDRVFRRPRIWSNRELARFAPFYTGSVANISGWRDQDKEGRAYRDYFSNCSDYHISNFNTETSGYQGDMDNEFFLDLEDELPEERRGAFDVVFNHTTLEHVFNIHTAFANLCAMARDSLVVVTPFLQQQHESFGDFWRFTPLAIQRLCRDQGFTPVYMNWNDDQGCSVYVFTIASREPERWGAVAQDSANRLHEVGTTFIGCNVVRNSWVFKLKRWLFGPC